MKRILVTGGAGFIGSHLCQRLVNEGHQVTVLDNLSTGRFENVSSGAMFWNRNVRTALAHERYFSQQVDEIYHLACAASPKAYQAKPIETMFVNIEGAKNVLDLAQKHNAKVLLTSTSEVYGDPEISPQREDYLGNVNCTGPRACYDEGKRAAECLFFDYHRQYGTRIKVARLFNTYGPGMAEDDGRVVSNFIVQALRGEPLTIYGDGSQTRSFCYVDDTVDGLIRLMESPDEVTGPVNIGNPDEWKVWELARAIGSIVCGAHYKQQNVALPQDDPKLRCPDITKARTLLGWEPAVDIDTGLRLTVDYFRARMETAHSGRTDLHKPASVVRSNRALEARVGPLGAPDFVNWRPD